jgi:hypothetical protein
VATGWQHTTLHQPQNAGPETTEIGLSEAVSAKDNNHPQTPPRPRNEGVRGSSPRVGFMIGPLRRAFLLSVFGSGKARRGLLLSLVGPRLAPSLPATQTASSYRNQHRAPHRAGNGAASPQQPWAAPVTADGTTRPRAGSHRPALRAIATNRSTVRSLRYPPRTERPSYFDYPAPKTFA